MKRYHKKAGRPRRDSLEFLSSWFIIRTLFKLVAPLDQTRPERSEVCSRAWPERSLSRPSVWSLRLVPPRSKCMSSSLISALVCRRSRSPTRRFTWATRSAGSGLTTTTRPRPRSIRTTIGALICSTLGIASSTRSRRRGCSGTTANRTGLIVATVRRLVWRGRSRWCRHRAGRSSRARHCCRS